MNDISSCESMTRANTFKQTSAWRPLQRAVIWAKRHLGWTRPFTFWQRDVDAHELRRSIRNPIDMQKRIEAAKTRALMLSIGMDIDSTRWDL
jgi:hypothetical protein